MIMDADKMMEAAGMDRGEEDHEHAERVAISFQQWVEQNPDVDEGVLVHTDGQNIGVANHISSNAGRAIASVVAKAMKWMMERTADAKGNVG